MQIQIPNYYDPSKFSNSEYLVMIATESFFANNIFRSDLTRVLYCSEQYAFRNRLNILAQRGEDPIKELQLPFMSYYRQGNWEIDDRPGVQNATAALYGFPESSASNQYLRWLQVKGQFSCVAFFNSDSDAQLGYESLLYIQQPSAKQFKFSSMEYLGTTFDIPIQLKIENLQWMPDIIEKDWLIRNRILPVKFDLLIRSVSFAQSPQTPESNIFSDQEVPVITEHVILDYLSYKFKNAHYDEEHIDFTVDQVITPDPALEGSLTTDTITNNSIKVKWDYSSHADSLYQTNVILVLNGIQQVTVLRSAKTYTFTGLERESIYKIDIIFTSLTNQIVKYSVTATTTTDSSLNLKGMIGY